MAVPLVCAFAAVCASVTTARAVPSFAEQTEQPCSACHIGGFGPQLTPFGRQFKLDGYTLRASPGFTNPISAMAVASLVNTAKDQAAPPAPHYSNNNNATIDQVSLFASGGMGDHFGGFTQWTYDGVGRAFSWDNLDLRAATHVTLFGSDVLTGVSLNNAPGVQDVWNTLPAWGYPYTGSDLAPAPGASTLLDGALAQTTLGATAYANWDFGLYAEAGLYWQPGRGFLSAVNAVPDNMLKGAAPYFRLAYQKDYGDQNFQLGAFALIAEIYPGSDMSVGTTDRYTDTGLDGSYEFMGDGSNLYTLNARYTHENQRLAASQILLAAQNPSDTLDDVRFDASYYRDNTYGATVGFFNTWGSTDALLYAGNSTLKPDSTGFTFQIDGTIFGRDLDALGGRFNLRAGLQYTLYTKFDGASSNYDGTGRNAADNNTVRVFVWTAL
jgi:hypothetical protein